MHQLTSEQQTIHDHVTTTEGLTLINSVAGSGKTTMLVSIANSIPHTNGLYLAYNSSIAKESNNKFPTTTDCRTTHSLAYRDAFVPNKFDLGNFSYRDISEKIKYEDKCELVDTIRTYCLSSYISFSLFCKDTHQPSHFADLGNKYLNLMAASSKSSKVKCTHEFYLKYYHIMLANGDITYDPFDFVMLDEAGDLNKVTLEIFRLLPSARKIAVGDAHQNIYQFNHTINCFDELADEGTEFPMSQSFRVSDTIAPHIEKFCRNYLKPNMSFKGVPISDNGISTRAYITRTNSLLIAKMIDLNASGTPYGLVRSPNEIFKLPLMLCRLKYKGFITNPAYKHLQEDVDDWHESTTLKLEYNTPLAYISSLYVDDFQLKQALRIIMRYGQSKVLETFEIAKQHQNKTQPYLLMTAHSAKGLEVDEVTLGDDLNESISDIVSFLNAGRTIDSLTASDIESLNLYYVAVSRCAKLLNNAVHL